MTKQALRFGVTSRRDASHEMVLIEFQSCLIEMV